MIKPSEFDANDADMASPLSCIFALTMVVFSTPYIHRQTQDFDSPRNESTKYRVPCDSHTHKRQFKYFEKKLWINHQCDSNPLRAYQLGIFSHKLRCGGVQSLLKGYFFN